jgi:hypothetical protein
MKYLVFTLSQQRDNENRRFKQVLSSPRPSRPTAELREPETDSDQEPLNEEVEEDEIEQRRRPRKRLSWTGAQDYEQVSGEEQLQEEEV